MAAEAKRGCGFRKVGGLYLVGTGLASPCDRLPFELPEVCPCCGAGIKQARGWTWVQGSKLLGGDHELEPVVTPCHDPQLGHHIGNRAETPLCPEDTCAVCRPALLGERCGLLWVGRQHYTPGAFCKEALDLGVSKRIAQVPKGLEPGKTWCLLAHPDAVPPKGKLEFGQDAPKPRPGIFYAFLVQAVEMIVTESQAQKAQEMEKLAKRGIRPVVVPDEDADHR